jgi:hypothetical protein
MAGSSDESESFSMVIEACDSYEARLLLDGRTEIRIVIPPRFADLWLIKLSELRGTLDDESAIVEGLPATEPDGVPGA